ncbi:MAG: hypothetical protein U1E76_05795 [Planctomycetota bacterium]
MASGSARTATRTCSCVAVAVVPRATSRWIGAAGARAGATPVMRRHSSAHDADQHGAEDRGHGRHVRA